MGSQNLLNRIGGSYITHFGCNLLRNPSHLSPHPIFYHGQGIVFCMKADPAYGNGVANALDIDVSEVK